MWINNVDYNPIDYKEAKKAKKLKKKLGFDPLNSPELNKKFDSHSLSNLDKTKDYLEAIGINPEFSEQLNNMFEEIKASTSEIMNIKPEMQSANNRIEKQTDLSRKTKTSLAVMKSAA